MLFLCKLFLWQSIVFHLLLGIYTIFETPEQILFLDDYVKTWRPMRMHVFHQKPLRGLSMKDQGFVIIVVAGLSRYDTVVGVY